MSVPHPSLSRDLDNAAPELYHSLHVSQSSFLSLAVNDKHIFGGSQSQDISVWDKKTCKLIKTLVGHTGSVLSLECATERGWLFSSSGDSTVRIWSTKHLVPLYVLNPYLETGAGDLFSLAWCSALQTVYIGCQNTSLQWYSFSDPAFFSSSTTTGTSTPKKVHKFFDSYPQYERRPADHNARNPGSSSSTGTLTPPVEETGSPTRLAVPATVHTLEIVATNVIDSAHYGYLYCMALVPSMRVGSDEPPRSDQQFQLVTGSGDETIKIWDLGADGAPQHVYTTACSHGAILSVVVRNDTIYAGCQDGYVKVWDLETRTLVRTIIVQEGVDILSLSMMYSDLYTCSANGQIRRWSASFDCTACWDGHPDGIILCSVITHGNSDSTFRLITGGNDNEIKIWDVEPPKSKNVDKAFEPIKNHTTGNKSLPIISSHSSTDTMVYALSKFISIPSVSGLSAHREDSRQAAIWLKKSLHQLGAQASLLPLGEGTNPLVLATFGSTGKNEKHTPRILFYGHYDVMPAPPDSWNSDPFTLTGRNGYLYGRGATDNKGPIMAVAFAAAELLRKRALGVELVFLIEGEEESGSRGFRDGVAKYKDQIGNIDAMLVSNSTWIAEESPCITYGLRGVVHCSIEISSDRPDLHSGVEGGAIVEPMLDMVKLISSLTDTQRQVQIPGFYDRVQPQTEEEKELYSQLALLTNRSAASLSSRWREPSLTVHGIEVSGPKNATVIPGTVKSEVSLRIVPDQDLETIAHAFSDYLETSFKSFNSPNTIQIKVDHTADWWLGKLDDEWFKALESAVQDEWGTAPLRIREGGSIPSVPYLEKEFGCPALHLPLGQSSDQAHLPNERISLINLHRGSRVVEGFLTKAANLKKG